MRTAKYLFFLKSWGLRFRGLGLLKVRAGVQSLRLQLRFPSQWQKSIATLLNQGKTKGQQLKGKIVSDVFALFLTIFRTFSEFSPQDIPLETKGFSSMGTKEKKRKDNKKNRTNRCCTLVVARLSCSY